MSFLQAIFIAILQGATELFPVSSLGHAVLIPALLGWQIHAQDPTFLPFMVMLHFGTAFALLIFFWKDWSALFKGALGKDGKEIQRQSFYIFSLLIVATLPAIFIGAFFEKLIRNLFSTPDIVSIFLVCNGIMLFIVDKLRKNVSVDKTIAIADLKVKDALFIGLFQCLAFFPGISRSGSTIVSGLIRNLSHENSARFSFLMALPVILAASAHQSWKIYKQQIPFDNILHMGIATIIGCITALLSTAFLMKYFKNNEKWALTPFGYYCCALGIIGFVVLMY